MRNTKLRKMLIVFCAINDALTGDGLHCEKYWWIKAIEYYRLTFYCTCDN